MKLKILSMIAFLSIMLHFASCKKEKEDPIIPNEEELITTFIYTLIDTLNQDTAILSIVDLDGDGGMDPIISADSLKANTVYYGSLQLLNESVDPAADIGDEVVEEGTEHQFFYEVQNSLNLAITYDDSDANGNPIGMRTWLSTGDPSNGELVIILRHEPDKYASGVSDGMITNAGGETDIEVNFETTVY
jgi:hypothetical protein